MANQSPGYKNYRIEGSNLSIPGWLISSRGEAVDRAVKAATNALVKADVTRNTKFRDPASNQNPIIDPSKSFRILTIAPTQVADVDPSSIRMHFDNQFDFRLIDERFIDKSKEFYTEFDIRNLFLHEPDAIDKAESYKIDNPTGTSLWGTVKAARELLRNDPYKIYNSDDKYKVLLTDTHSAQPRYAKVTAAHLDSESVGNSVAQAQEHLYDAIHMDTENNVSKLNQVLVVIEVDELDEDGQPTGNKVKDLAYRYITDDFIYGNSDSAIDADDAEKNTSKSELWNTIVTARDYLQNRIDKSTNINKVLLTDASGVLEYNKVTDAHLAAAVETALETSRDYLSRKPADIENGNTVLRIDGNKNLVYSRLPYVCLDDNLRGRIDCVEKYLTNSSILGGPAEYTVLTSNQNNTVAYSKITEDYLADEIENITICSSIDFEKM